MNRIEKAEWAAAMLGGSGARSCRGPPRPGAGRHRSPRRREPGLEGIAVVGGGGRAPAAVARPLRPPLYLLALPFPLRR